MLSAIVRLPHRLRLAIGSGLGLLVYYLARRRRIVVEKNLELCFPEMDEKARARLARDTFSTA